MDEKEKRTPFPNPNYEGFSHDGPERRLSDVCKVLPVLVACDRLQQRITEDVYSKAASEYAELIHRSTHDTLTGAFNREALGRLIETEFDPNRDHNLIGVVVIDINNFKIINDTLGHMAGDQVLIDMANYLNHNTRQCDLVFRLGEAADEFVIVCHNNRKTRDFEKNIETMVKRRLVKKSMPASFSYGCAAFNRDLDTTFEDTMVRADLKMYEQKHAREELSDKIDSSD